MNNLQKGVLFVGGVILLANLVFPPWEIHERRFVGTATRVTITDAGRHFLGDPPTHTVSTSTPYLTFVSYINWSYLAATSLVIVVGAGLLFGLAALYKKPHPGEAMSRIQHLVWSLGKLWRLRSITRRLIGRDEVAEGKKGLFALIREDPATRRILEDLTVDDKELDDLYGKLLRCGAGVYVNGRWIPASALVCGQTLTYILRHRNDSDDAFKKVCEWLWQYFSGNESESLPTPVAIRHIGDGDEPANHRARPPHSAVSGTSGIGKAGLILGIMSLCLLLGAIGLAVARTLFWYGVMAAIVVGLPLGISALCGFLTYFLNQAANRTANRSEGKLPDKGLAKVGLVLLVLSILALVSGTVLSAGVVIVALNQPPREPWLDDPIDSATPKDKPWLNDPIIEVPGQAPQTAKRSKLLSDEEAMALPPARDPAPRKSFMEEFGELVGEKPAAQAQRQAPAPRRGFLGEVEALLADPQKIDTTKLKLKCIETAIEAYKVNVGHYPTEPEGGLEALRTKPSFNEPWHDSAAIGQNWRGPYLKEDPLDSWGHKYNYMNVQRAYRVYHRSDSAEPGTPEADLTPFILWSNGPDGISGTADDIKNWSHDNMPK